VTNVDTVTKDVFSAVVDPDRVAVLERTGLLRATDETTFDRFARVACALVDAPVAFVTLVDLDEQVLRGAWRRDEPPNNVRRMPLQGTFCWFSVVTGEKLVVNDARVNPLVRHAAPVAREEIVAYAGFPLQTAGGHVLGSLCVIDRRPREWSSEQLALLHDLAVIVVHEIEHRLASKSIDDLGALGRQLADRLSGMADAVHGVAELAEQQDDLRLHRFTALAVSRVDQVKDLTGQLQKETAAQVCRADEPAWVDLREAVDRAVRSTQLATSTGAIEADLGPVALPVRCDPVQLERSITHVLVAALHHMTGDAPLRVVLGTVTGTAGPHTQAPVAQLTVSGPSSRVPAAELARIVARFRAAIGEVIAERSQVASIRMLAGQTSASNGSIVANSTTDGLTLIGQWAL
jgi:signal transduction histidine kinase